MAFPIEEMDDDFAPADSGSELKSDLIRICGAEAAEKFMQTFAGCRLRIPYQPSPKSRLAQSIGIDAATAFAAEYGGEVMDVPGGELSAWNQRTRLMERMLLAGAPSFEIARETRCTERAVRYARARLRAKGLLA